MLRKVVEKKKGQTLIDRKGNISKSPDQERKGQMKEETKERINSIHNSQYFLNV